MNSIRILRWIALLTLFGLSGYAIHSPTIWVIGWVGIFAGIVLAIMDVLVLKELDKQRQGL